MQEIRGLTHLHFIIYQLYDYSMFREGHYRDIILLLSGKPFPHIKVKG